MAGVEELQPEGRAVSEQAFHLLGEMPGHDGHAIAAGSAQLAQHGRDDRQSVDRQDRLRPALGHRPEPSALAGGHHDCFH